MSLEFRVSGLEARARGTAHDHDDSIIHNNRSNNNKLEITKILSNGTSHPSSYKV